MFLKVILESTRKEVNSDPKNMSPRDRIEEFPGENLCPRGGKLFCTGCKEILSSKKSILKNHLASKKHAAGKEKLKVTKKRDHVRTCVFATLKAGVALWPFFLCRVICCPTNMSRHLSHGSLGGRTCGT